MPSLPRRLRWIAGSTAVVLSSCSAVHHVHRTVSDQVEHIADEVVAHPVPKITCDQSMKGLAHDLDSLEKSIDWYGSIVPKSPDIWGEARLTRHRFDFEKEIFEDLDGFSEKINAQESRADAAFIAQAFSLSVATSKGSINVTPGTEKPPEPPDVKPKKFKKEVALEPTVFLEQKTRYLNFLNQLRRNNEGDDTSDSPGYSLNLVRVPVSLLPGKRTQQGYGGEITFTLEPVLSNELLPTTMRSLLAADLVESFAPHLAQILFDKKIRDEVTSANEGDFTEKPSEPKKDNTPAQPQGLNNLGPNLKPESSTTSVAKLGMCKKMLMKDPTAAANNRTGNVRGNYLNGRSMYLFAGEGMSLAILRDATISLPTHRDGDLDYIHLPDLQNFLKQKIQEAQRFLTTQNNLSLWADFCTPDLAQALRNENSTEVARLRGQFANRIKEMTSTKALAWCMICDAALVTERLLEDIRELSTARGKPINAPSWTDIAFPIPSAEARQLFNDYVKVRWPIHVFALDPMTQEQNVQDAATLRREKQFALSAAFVSGKVTASRFLREARTLELQAETIALNRTQLGFSHGESTFGWRFYPRYQVPGYEHGVHDKIQADLFGSLSEPEKLRQRRLEPGPRECVAIVLMPCFVPYLRCDSFSNWFRLDNPKDKVFDHTQAVQLGKHIKTLQVHGPSVGDSGAYRDGDFDRMIRRIEQLDTRMPSQTMSVLVPVRENLSGSDLFAAGTAALAPELYGFYGAPGIDLEKDFVTLFLVGDRFSVNQTWVSIGNTRGEYPKDGELSPFRLLSRQVLQIRIKTEGIVPDRDGFAHIHVATPYGVTQVVRVPVLRSKKPAEPTVSEGYSITPEKIVITYEVERLDPTKLKVLGPVAVDTTKGLTIDVKDSLGSTPPSLRLTITVPNNNESFTIDTPPLQRVDGQGQFSLSQTEVNNLAKQIVQRLVGSKSELNEKDSGFGGPLKAKVSVQPITDGMPAKLVGKSVPAMKDLEIELKPKVVKP